MISSTPNFLSSEDDALPVFASAETEAEDARFREYYEREVKPLTVMLEARRLDAVAEAARRKPRAWMLGVAVVFCAFWLAGRIGEAAGWLGAVACFLLYAWARKPLDEYKEGKQGEMLASVVRFFGDDFTYRREGTADFDKVKIEGVAAPSGFFAKIGSYYDFGAFMPGAAGDAFSHSAIKAMQIVPMGNRLHVSDRIAGTHSGTRIEVAEVKTEIKGDKHTRLLFNGLLVTLEFAKAFHGMTIVKKESGQRRVFAAAGNLETVSLEDPVFEKQFEAYSNDQVEARFLLTPDFMIRLLDLVQAWKGSGVQCSFIAKKLHIAIPVPVAAGMFELSGAEKPADDWESAQKVYRELRDVVGIIDVLKLRRAEKA